MKYVIANLIFLFWVAYCCIQIGMVYGRVEGSVSSAEMVSKAASIIIECGEDNRDQSYIDLGDAIDDLANKIEGQYTIPWKKY